MKRELQKQMIKRNIIFWGKNAEKYVFMMTGIVFLYGLFFSSYMRGNQNKFNKIWDVLFAYQFMITQITSFTLSISVVTYIPLVISFGSKRKEAVWGSQLMHWLVIVQMEALLLFFAALSSTEFSERFALLAIVAPIGMVIGLSLGQIIATVGLKFGMQGMLWIGIVVAVILIFTVVIIALIFPLYQEKNLFLEYLPVAGTVAVLAGVLYIGSIFVILRTIRNYEVHR